MVRDVSLTGREGARGDWNYGAIWKQWVGLGGGVKVEVVGVVSGHSFVAE